MASGAQGKPSSTPLDSAGQNPPRPPQPHPRAAAHCSPAPTPRRHPRRSHLPSLRQPRWMRQLRLRRARGPTLALAVPPWQRPSALGKRSWPVGAEEEVIREL